VTSAGLLKALGRVVLWCVLGLLLLRGVADLLRADETAPPARGSVAAPAAWPDDQARAFAVDFARTYLAYSPRDRDERALAAFVLPELAASIVPEQPGDAERQVVQTATVAGTTALDDRHALVTVAATVSSGTRYLAVPVGRDARGALVVYDLPSFEPPPARASLPATQGEPLTGADRSQIEDVVERFLRSFLAGRPDELDYLAPTGAQLGALAHEHEVVGVVSLAQVGPAAADTREVVATVRARDSKTGAVYALRYRLRLVREDRWYVAAVNNATRKGG
jgi:Conjugative transposon protein TcpC